MASRITLSPLSRFTDAAVLLMRLTVGGFLVWGVWDNITSAAHMAKFAAFLRQYGFPFPQLLAPFDVWLQFAVGVAFILGLATRWAGLLCAVNFIVAIVMVDQHAGIRGSWPAAGLVLMGLLLATHGPGRISLDAILFRERGRRRR